MIYFIYLNKNINMVEFQILFLYIFISLIKKFKNECPKDTPIQTINGCEDIYCTDIQFENGDCIIYNSIVKKQWLNDIFTFGESNTKTIEVVEIPNNDIIFINSFDNDGLYSPSLYGLKSSGEFYFIGKYFSFQYNYYSMLNGVGLNIGNKYYLIFCNFLKCALFDLEKNSFEEKDYNELLQNDENIYTMSFSFTLINLDKKGKILFTLLNSELYLSIINIKLNDFSSFEKIHKANGQDQIQMSEQEKLPAIKCFVTDKKLTECLYAHDNKYFVAIYDESLNYLNSIFLQDVTLGGSFFNVINAILLKKEIGAFTYYINNVNTFSPFRLQINELYFNEVEYTFNNIIPEKTISLGDYQYYTSSDTNILREDMIKITDNIFSYIITYSDDIIYIIIFDLYNNDENLFVRYYKVNFKLYNIKIDKYVKLFIFNSFLGFYFIGGTEDKSEDTPIYVILGNSIMNINKITLDIYKLNQGFILDLKDHYSSIDNNLFGYELNIKISSIANGLEGIRFFSINKNEEIHINELINEEDRIIFDFSDVNAKIGENYFIGITSTINGPEYNKFIELYDNYEQYGEDYSNYYESRIVEEKIFTIEIKFSCHESSISCDYPNLTTKTIQNDLNNIIYLSNFKNKGEENNLLNLYLNLNNYDSNNYCNNNVINIKQYNFKNKCINECTVNYFHDSLNNCILMCQNENKYVFNSECYDNCPEGTIIDLSEKNFKICKCKELYYIDENNYSICLSSLICDDNHPILEKFSNECLNYRVQYRNEYYYECPKNTCISERFETENICEEKLSNTKIFNGFCFNNYSFIISQFEEIINKNIKLNKNERMILNVYSYNNYSKNFDQLLSNNLKYTMIDLRECLSLYKKTYNIDEETDIYIVIVETPRVYSNETINRFDFELYFDNLTKINNLDICNDIKMKVYSPITNPKLLNLELGQYFYEQGSYNIFNKEDKFYIDVCSGAYIDDNDITLNDRYIDIYPHDIQICPNDCELSFVNFTLKEIICDCKIKLNENDDYEYELMNKDEIINYFKDFHNIIQYFNDFFNYKIIKCYKLFLNSKNYKNNKGLIIGISFFIASFILLIIFRVIGYSSIRVIFHTHLKDLRNKNGINSNNNNNNNKKVNDANSNKIIIYAPSLKKTDSLRLSIDKSKIDSDNYSSTKRFLNNRKSSKFMRPSLRLSHKGLNNYIIKCLDDNKNEKIAYNKKRRRKSKDNIKIDNIFINIEKKEVIQNNIKDKKEDADEIMNNKEMNELPYAIAQNKDSRGFFKILLSIFCIKIDLIQIIFHPEEYSSRYLLFGIYLLNSYINLFMNCILYNDYAVSQKYHNNGQLEFITSLIISIISNIFTSMIIYFINLLTNFPSYIENIIKEIKNPKEYFYIISKLFVLIEFKFCFIIVIEILFGLFMIYYLFIFNVINSNSINSFLLNYLYSQLDSIFYSFCLCLFISILRKISLIFKIKRLYIISNYFNEHF